MAQIGMLYSTTDGHTLEICERLQQRLTQRDHQVTLLPIEAGDSIDWQHCDKLVIGARIRYGKHHPLVYAFIERHRERLQTLPSAFFSVNVVARKPGKDTVSGNPYLRKFLQKSQWQATELAVFAGKIEYRKYRFWDRHMIRLIMWLTNGPLDRDACVDFTDWAAVDVFANRIDTM
jgi:menaquinone-dependent protoporphyrinogen oxidase